MNKLERLKRTLGEMGSALLAYSGGVDSTFLLKVASDTLGNNLLAVTATSPTFPRRELAFAKAMARELNVRHKILRTKELQDTRFIANTAQRCYFCKRELFRRLGMIARQHRLKVIVDATTLSDRYDFRPGEKAKRELKVRSPLSEAGFTKADIRRYSRKLNLNTWDKPSLACLASRVPYGRRINVALLKRIEKAEEILRQLGFVQVRVRDYGCLCRIEIPKNGIASLIKKREAITKRIKRLGYEYVTVDLEGYRSGSMNALLRGKQR